MFEEYLQDSYEFLVRAREASNTAADQREARRCYRAAVFYAAGAMEAFLNYAADSFAQAESLTPHEIAFLNDKTLVFCPGSGKVVQRAEFHRVQDKLRVLLGRFVPEFEFKAPSWSQMIEFKRFRDSLVHPRAGDDETPLAEYDARVRAGLSAIIEIMNCISEGVFKKPLRKQLLDLIPD
jgi:hypothetical protein